MSTENDMTYNEQIEKAINAWGTHWFKFDESNGNITDSKGTAIGTIYGATRTNGWDGDGYAIDFDGIDDYVEFNNPLIIQGDKSIRFKLKVKSKSSKTQTILANSNTGAGKKGFFVEIPANTLTVRFVHNYETTIIQEVRSSKELVVGEWADILISADTIKKTYSIFINGELTGSSIITVELSELLNGNLRIGRNTTTLSSAYYSFNGQIDDLQIYSKALTPTDIPILNKTLILHEGEYKKFHTNPKEMKSLVPTLTSDTSASDVGNAISVSNSSIQGYLAFNKANTNTNGSDAWFTSTTGSIGFNFNEPRYVESYTIRTVANILNSPYAPINWILEGSDDLTIWEKLDEVNSFSWTGINVVQRSLEEHNGYKAYRVTVNGNNGASNGNVIIGELEFWGYNSKPTIEEWKSISSTLPTKDQFLSDGMDSLSPLLNRRVETLEPLPMDKSEILSGEEGKVFSKTLDLKKYMDLRSIKVEVK